MATQALTAAENAVAVQIDGHNNTVKIIRAGAELALNRLHTRRAKPESTIELLRTDIRATKFVGRSEECHQLTEWRSAPQPIAVLCFTGGAGAGKTRLAIEACETAEAEGWIAGLAPSAELARFHATHNLVHWVLPQHALIVVDYAATSLAVLKSWFAALAPQRHRQSECKLRILLLERQADAENGWWCELKRRDSADRAGPADLIGTHALFPLPPLAMVADRRTLLAETMLAAAPLLEPPAPVQSPPAPGTDPWFDKKLADNTIGNEPLHLMMGGVYAARHGARAALALERLELADEMAEIESERLRKFAEARRFADRGDLLRHLAACITLQNGCPYATLAKLIEEERNALGFQAPFGVDELAEQLSEYLPSANGAVEPIRPDLIGESFLLPAIKGGRFRTEQERRDIVLRAYRRAGPGTVDTLIRCARDFAAGSADHPAVQWLRAIVEASDDVAELMRMSNSLPQSTLSLREFALNVEEKIAAVLRHLFDQHPDAFAPNLATSLNNLANRLGDLGRREDALDAAQEAVSLRRALAAARPDAFTPNLAASLNNLANRLGDLGRREDALAAAQEAVSLRRMLAAARPDAFTPNLAASLNNLANFLSAVGRREDALAAAQEAAALYRALAAARPDAFTPDLAASLNNLANVLSAVGRREDALAAAQEAVSLRRALAAAGPDAFTPDLAMSLSVMADMLEGLGRITEAVPTDEEAVRLLSPYFLHNPTAFAGAILSYAKDYVRRSQILGRDADHLLLGPIAEALEVREASQ